MEFNRTKLIYYIIFVAIIISIITIAILAAFDYYHYLENHTQFSPMDRNTSWTTIGNTPISSDVGFISWPFMIIWIITLAIVSTTVLTILWLLYSVLTSWLMGHEFSLKEWWED